MASSTVVGVLFVSVLLQGTFAYQGLLAFLMSSSKKADEAGRGRNEFNEPWLLATGMAVGKPYEYLDEDGNIQGFHKDLVMGVCKEAGQDCDVIYDDYDNCYHHEESGSAVAGEGILGRWYDGCMGYFRTPLRVPLFSFSVPLFNSDDPYGEFYVLKGNPKGVDLADVTGKRVAFLDGWAADEKCLALDGTVDLSPLPTENKIYLKKMYKVLHLLRAGEVDAVFVPHKAMPADTDDLEKLGFSIECSSEHHDLSVHYIFKKGSRAVDWFNPAFERLKENGKYHKLCHEAEIKHGGTVDCLL
ncbi:arginine-binding periplasmic protein-like isoform X2 [Ptychodera flava]|uniref:arginine-binding periplasmic protein-like isoform X2 n=1 Tax=Ptychodera flava TaxID=63121 RepID=UPI00396A4B7A